MKKLMTLTALCFALLFTTTGLAAEVVVLETNYGKITLELNEKKAPITVANFLSYVDSGHYAGTIFHRVIKDFMIQGGNFTVEMAPQKTQQPIKNEADNGLKNLRGTIAMARTGVVDSATSQFFINLKDNAFLDHKSSAPREFGYAVFGQVVSGMDVVDRIGVSQTHTFKGFRDVPVEPVVIEKAYRQTSD
ncbi:MAG: peptidyl-prolyl cis-trans isomerase [Deltaproteobacteria bacterium]|nr:peptidyl-prolyl cis-trans isomerase [Deltaproteobacteria bacterium]MBW2477722.1 peptidyl-prolyl cis-trans isomerase [Deltaproteobacteria bacterium]MBW2520502.1 peptidyl-prolyl cis-trans isomerase [Deltaproteobacteria bacterium]